jgi:glucosamine--fructose-6-phosphate aminotransferase (isomerizing)
VNKGDTQVSAMADYIIEIPETSECFSPIVASIPLQLLSYYIAVIEELMWISQETLQNL